MIFTDKEKKHILSVYRKEYETALSLYKRALGEKNLKSLESKEKFRELYSFRNMQVNYLYGMILFLEQLEIISYDKRCAEEKRIEINFNSEELLDFCYGRERKKRFVKV